MSQDNVELILGRLLTDGGFRRRFFAEQDRELRHLELVEQERESLRRLDPKSAELLIELLAARLDPRIRRG